MKIFISSYHLNLIEKWDFLAFINEFLIMSVVVYESHKKLDDPISKS